jgi:hypothetical protein
MAKQSGQPYDDDDAFSPGRLRLDLHLGLGPQQKRWIER